MYRKFLIVAAMAILAGACSRLPVETGVSFKNRQEYFAESKYGRKASPRVIRSASEIRNHSGNYVKISKAYKVKNRWYYPKKSYEHFKQIGKASWYGSAFQGRLTANGEVYDMNALSAAHPTMPLPSYARVTNLSNGESIIVRVNDRGPYVSNRIIDLSKQAAQMLHYKDTGLAKVKVEYLGLAPLKCDDSRYLLASYRPAGSQHQTHSIMLAENKEIRKATSYKDNTLAYAPSFPKIGPILSFKNM